MAFLEKFAFAPAMVSYLCSELQTVAFMACYSVKINQNFSEHVLYAWFVCHCDGLHALGAHNRDKPFHAFATSRRSLPLTLEQARKHHCNFWILGSARILQSTLLTGHARGMVGCWISQTLTSAISGMVGWSFWPKWRRNGYWQFAQPILCSGGVM